MQSSDPKQLLIKTKDILNDYKYDVPAIEKIFSELLSVIKAKEFNVKSVSKNLSKELIPVFDKCFLMPLPKFEDAKKYEDEVIKVSKDLKILHLKNRIREISRDLKKNDGDGEVESIREEISAITSQMSSS